MNQKILFSSLVFIFSFTVAVLLSKVSFASAHKIKVMIDPGHGGEDDGAVNKKIKEKNITLSVSLDLKKILDRDSGYEVFLTRERDVYVSLDARTEKAKANKVDVFVSIHANSSPESKARGTEFYFENQNPTDEEDMFLANRENNVKSSEGDNEPSTNNDLQNILTDLAHNEHMVLSQQLSQHLLDAFQKKLNIKTRAIRQAPFRVLSVTMPATLIELGFISNDKESMWLAQPSVQKEMASAIYQGLQHFKEKLDKVHNSSLN